MTLHDVTSDFTAIYEHGLESSATRGKSGNQDGLYVSTAG